MGDERELGERVAVLEKGMGSVEKTMEGLRVDFQQLSQNMLNLSQSLLKAWPPEAAKLFGFACAIIGVLGGLSAAFWHR